MNYKKQSNPRVLGRNLRMKLMKINRLIEADTVLDRVPIPSSGAGAGGGAGSEREGSSHEVWEVVSRKSIQWDGN